MSQKNEKNKQNKNQTLRVSATFTYASDQMSGNILVVDPPGGQMENHISRGSLAESKEQTNQ